MDQLSPHERRLAELVTRGYSNRQIAGEVYLSEKTVESHLSRIFEKLGLKSRVDLAREMTRALERTA